MIVSCPKVSADYLKAVTLIELLIVVGIVAVISAALLPSFSGFSEKQALEQGTQNLISDIHLVQGKALSGAVYDTNSDGTKERVWWGINLCKSSLGDNSSAYQLGYALDASTGPFVALQDKTLSAGVEFDNCIAHKPFYFKRLTGRLDKSTIEITIKAVGSSLSKRVKINTLGNVEVD